MPHPMLYARISGHECVNCHVQSISFPYQAEKPSPGSMGSLRAIMKKCSLFAMVAVKTGIILYKWTVIKKKKKLIINYITLFSLFLKCSVAVFSDNTHFEI